MWNVSHETMLKVHIFTKDFIYPFVLGAKNLLDQLIVSLHWILEENYKKNENLIEEKTLFWLSTASNFLSLPHQFNLKTFILFSYIKVSKLPPFSTTSNLYISMHKRTVCDFRWYFLRISNYQFSFSGRNDTDQTVALPLLQPNKCNSHYQQPEHTSSCFTHSNGADHTTCSSGSPNTEHHLHCTFSSFTHRRVEHGLLTLYSGTSLTLVTVLICAKVIVSEAPEGWNVVYFAWRILLKKITQTHKTSGLTHTAKTHTAVITRD